MLYLSQKKLRFLREPWKRNDNSFQYSCLENSMNRGAWQAIQSMGLQSQAWLSNYHSHSFLIVPFLNTMGNTTISREALWALKALFSNWYSSATCPPITSMVLAYIFWEIIAMFGSTVSHLTVINTVYACICSRFGGWWYIW